MASRRVIILLDLFQNEVALLFNRWFDIEETGSYHRQGHLCRSKIHNVVENSNIFPVTGVGRIASNRLLRLLLGKWFHCVVLYNFLNQNLFCIFISLPFLCALRIAAISGPMLPPCI